jgi:hypothetical protein
MKKLVSVYVLITKFEVVIGHNNLKYILYSQKESPNAKKSCKYGFAAPIMNQTIILDPLVRRRGTNTESNFTEVEQSKAECNYRRIRKELDRLGQEQVRARKGSAKTYTVTTLDGFLKGLGDPEIDLNDYMLALRWSINSPTIFLKRTCHEILINPYNRDLISAWRGNMDIQYILNSYGVVVYLTSYLMKSHGVMNRLLQIVAADMLADHRKNHKQKLMGIANKFQNCSEVGAPECVYRVLSMPVSCCSRQVVFINTFPINERFSMLKPDKMLHQMKDDATNVYLASIQEKYSNRPKKSMGNICLAEFASAYNYFTCKQYQQITKSKKRGLPVAPQAEPEENEEEIDTDGFTEETQHLELAQAEGDDTTAVTTKTSVDEDDNDEKTFYKLENGMGYVQRRLK